MWSIVTAQIVLAFRAFVDEKRGGGSEEDEGKAEYVIFEIERVAAQFSRLPTPRQLIDIIFFLPCCPCIAF